MSDLRLDIDKNDLDNEFVELPHQMQAACDKAAYAVFARDEAEGALTIIDAELYQEVYNLGKSTVDMVKAKVNSHPKHRQALANYNQAKLDAALALSCEKAVKTKEKSLDSLAKLYADQYWVKTSGDKPNTTDAKYRQDRAVMARHRVKG